MHPIEMCWLVFRIVFIQYVVTIDADVIRLSQLEKLVADLKVSHGVLLQKISKMEDENNYFEASLTELYAENEQLKGMMNNLQDENRTQKKFNSQLKMEITHIKKSSLLQTDISKTVVETDGLLTDDYKSVKTNETNSSTSGIQQRGTSVNNSASTSYKRLLSTGKIISNTVFYFKYIPLVCILYQTR